MMSVCFSIELTEKVVRRGGHSSSMPSEQIFPPKPENRESDTEIEQLLDQESKALGLRKESNVIINPHKMGSERRAADLATGVTEIIQFVTTYKTDIAILAGGAGAAAYTALSAADKLLGLIIKWRKLNEGRTITLMVGDKELQIEDGAELEEVVKAIDETLRSQK